MNPLYFLIVGVFLSCGGVDSFKIDESVDVTEVRPCKNAEAGYTSCYSLLVDTKTLRDNIINLPSGLNLPLTRHFQHDERTNVFLYDDQVLYYYFYIFF